MTSHTVVVPGRAGAGGGRGELVGRPERPAGRQRGAGEFLVVRGIFLGNSSRALDGGGW